jgi:hypothetical protein
MADRRTSKAVAVITTIWLLASIAVLTLATAGTEEAQAQGCRRGGSPSPSPSASASSSGGGGLPTNVTTILPLPGQSSASPSASPSGSASPSASRSPSPSGTASEAPPDREIPVLVAQQTTCKSTITISYKSGRNAKFSGKVGSGEPMCKRARDVQVKKVKKGKDQVVGRAVTNAKGAYQVPAANANGRFYARVSKATVENDDGETITCQAAKSQVIRP